MVTLGPGGEDGSDMPDAKLGGLLDRKFHRRLLDHRHQQLNVRADRLGPELFLGCQHDALFQDVGEDAAPLAILAIEHHQSIAELQPHHLGQIARLVQRRSQGGSRRQGLGQVKADHRCGPLKRDAQTQAERARRA